MLKFFKGDNLASLKFLIKNKVYMPLHLAFILQKIRWFSSTLFSLFQNKENKQLCIRTLFLNFIFCFIINIVFS